MSYILNTPADQQAMLDAIGVEVRSTNCLRQIPPEVAASSGELQIPPALSEIELTSHVGQLAARNVACGQKACFLGGGSYDHFVPAVVDYVASRGEFYTSYTPYQPEASQGNLQAFFEYQTLITQLTGMDVSNASLYDGGSAATEARADVHARHRAARPGGVPRPACIRSIGRFWKRIWRIWKPSW